MTSLVGKPGEEPSIVDDIEGLIKLLPGLLELDLPEVELPKWELPGFEVFPKVEIPDIPSVTFDTPAFTIPLIDIKIPSFSFGWAQIKGNLTQEEWDQYIKRVDGALAEHQPTSPGSDASQLFGKAQSSGVDASQLYGAGSWADVLADRRHVKAFDDDAEELFNG